MNYAPSEFQSPRGTNKLFWWANNIQLERCEVVRRRKEHTGIKDKLEGLMSGRCDGHKRFLDKGKKDIKLFEFFFLLCFAYPFFFFSPIASIPLWTYFDRHIICMTKAFLNMKKKCCLTSFIFKQTQSRPVPNLDHPCEVILQSQWHSMCAVQRVGVIVNIHLRYFRITIYIYL